MKGMNMRLQRYIPRVGPHIHSAVIGRSRRLARDYPRAARVIGLLLGVVLVAGLAEMASPRPINAEAGWQWCKMDAHVHSSVSSDATADPGMVAYTGKANGYCFLPVTDHNGASSFHINFLNANHMVFDDTYTRWETGTYGSLSSTTNALASTPVNTGAKSLHLKAVSNTSGEAYLTTKRGPNWLAANINAPYDPSNPSIVLRVSIYPVRIDPGSGVDVSLALGGDPTVLKDPLGYTTALDNTPKPGKSTVLTWQLGATRAASTNPSARVLTYSLGAYALNRWNTYTIDVGKYLRDIPLADRPIDLAGMMHLKMTARGNGGTADAYFDTYSIDVTAPAAPADEYVNRTGIVKNWDAADNTFKMWPAYEMGQTRHTQDFDFGPTDVSQYRSYQNGTDGILEAQQDGFPTQLNHPGTTVTIQESIDNNAYGADFIEIREQAWIDAWDEILKKGAIVLGSWGVDSHNGLDAGKHANYILAPPSPSWLQVMRSFYEGRMYMARNDFKGRIIFNRSSTSQEPHPARYPVYVSDSLGSTPVHLNVTASLRDSYRMRWYVNDALIANEGPNQGSSAYKLTKTISLAGPRTYVRAEVLSSSTSIKGATNPIFFIDVPGMPVDKSFHVEAITTPDGKGYNTLLTKGISAASWDAASESLGITLGNRTGSLVELVIATNTAPDRARVDGQLVDQAADQATFDAAAGSIWYYDGSAKVLHLKAKHTIGTADVKVAFGQGTDIEPPTAPSGLALTAITSERIDLAWTASTDNVGVAGYNIYRSAANDPGGAVVLSASTGPGVTNYSDTGLAPETTYAYEVRARDGAGNISDPSTRVSATTARQLIFSDGFETRDMSLWTSNLGLIVQQADVRSGSSAARATTSSAAVYAYKQLGSEYPEVYYRLWFKVISKDTTTSAYLLKFRSATGTSILGLFVDKNGRLGYRNDVAALSSISGSVVTDGNWHEVEMRALINGTAGQTEVWLDGSQISTLTKTENLGTAKIGRLQLGDNATGKAFDIVLDDVGVNTVRVGP